MTPYEPFNPSVTLRTHQSHRTPLHPSGPPQDHFWTSEYPLSNLGTIPLQNARRPPHPHPNPNRPRSLFRLTDDRNISSYEGNQLIRHFWGTLRIVFGMQYIPIFGKCLKLGSPNPSTTLSKSQVKVNGQLITKSFIEAFSLV